MAITEKYVSSLAGGGGDGSVGTPWTLTEALTDSASNGAGTRYNIKADGAYTMAYDTVGPGTAAAPCILRGYTTTIGDGNQGRSADGSLDTSNMPTINVTGGSAYWDGCTYTILESLNFQKTGTTNTGIFEAGGTLTCFVNCNFYSTYGAGSASAGVILQSYGVVFDCDVEMTGTTYGHGVGCSGAYVRIVGCRIKIAGSSARAISANNATSVIGCLIHGDGATGITATDPVYASSLCVANCTARLPSGVFYSLPNTATPSYMPCVVNCHVTDSSYMMNNLHSGTASVPAFRAYNRTRDNANADAGFGDWPIFDAVTTDTGGEATDYTDYASGDFTLIAAAPGKGAGYPANMDIGAYQREEPSASGGGSFVISG